MYRFVVHFPETSFNFILFYSHTFMTQTKNNVKIYSKLFKTQKKKEQLKSEIELKYMAEKLYIFF